MNKYYLVMRNTWDEIVTYRLNFFMWRIRSVLQLITIFFLWSVLIQQGKQLFGYTQEEILTYVLLSPLIIAIVFATRTHEIGENINNGDLSIFLIRPFNYFGYWFARDMGDKAMNISFSIIEIVCFYLIIHPPLFIQTNVIYILLMIVAIALAMILQFIIGSLLGLIGFWSPEIWAPRFVYFILRDFFAGLIIPIDVFPPIMQTVMKFLPFQYLLYFPLKIYLGQIPVSEIYSGFAVMLLWIGILAFMLSKLWRRGLREYSAVGR